MVNNSSLQAEIDACPAYYDKTITDVIPGTYSKVQLKITDYVPSEEEIKDLEDFDEVKGRTITNRQYIKIDLLADGNPVMEKLNWG